MVFFCLFFFFFFAFFRSVLCKANSLAMYVFDTVRDRAVRVETKNFDLSMEISTHRGRLSFPPLCDVEKQILRNYCTHKYGMHRGAAPQRLYRPTQH